MEFLETIVDLNFLSLKCGANSLCFCVVLFVTSQCCVILHRRIGQIQRVVQFLCVDVFRVQFFKSMACKEPYTLNVGQKNPENDPRYLSKMA